MAHFPPQLPLLLLSFLLSAVPARAEDAAVSELAVPRFFSGQGDFMIVARNHGALSGANAATLAAWVKPAGSLNKAQHLISVSVGGGKANWRSRAAFGILEGGVIAAWARTEDNRDPSHEVKTSAGAVRAGRWQHVAAVIDYSHSTIRVFVNGKRRDTGAISGRFQSPSTPATPSDSVALGSEDDGSSFFFHGTMAQAKIWNRALSDAEIRGLAATKPEN